MEGPSDVVGLANYIVYKFKPNPCTDYSYRTYLNMFKDSAFSTNISRFTKLNLNYTEKYI